MASFTALPTELKLNVFAFIRPKRDQKTVCLVSHEWKRLMAPILWESLNTNLQETPSRRLDVLLDRGNGILQHVRRLRLEETWDDEEDEEDEEDQKYPEREVALLLECLPKDRLTAFSAYAVSLSIMTLLLQKQSRLEDLHTPLLPGSRNLSRCKKALSKAITSWNMSSMAGLTSLSVYIRPDWKAEVFLEPLRYLLSNSPRLDKLVICNDTTKEDPYSNQYASLVPALPLRLNVSALLVLKSLVLSELSLGEVSCAMLHEIDVSRLECLISWRCTDVTPFFTALSSLFFRTGSSLKKIKLGVSSEEYLLCRVVEAFLQTWRGLEVIVTAMTHDVPKEGIMYHANTLKRFSLGGYQVQLSLDLVEIFRKCLRLEHVTTTLDISGSFCTRDDEVRRSNVKALLQSLAKLPQLRVLKLLSFPVIDFGLDPGQVNGAYDEVIISESQDYTAQEVMQNLANDILKYLVRCGSHIKVLNIWPYWSPNRWLMAASWNEHGILDYTYLKKILLDGSENERAVARPLSFARLELLDALILFG